MRKLLALFVVLVVALAAFLWFQSAREHAPVQPETGHAARPPHESVQEPHELVSAAEAADRTALEQGSSPPSRALAASTGPRCRIFGRVLDENGVAIGGARATIMVRGGRWSDVAAPENVKRRSGAEWLETTTAADGVFQFEAPLPTAGQVSLTITPDAHHALADRDYGSAVGSDNPPLVEGDNDLGDLTLAPRGAARGRVRSDDGRPIAGAHVNASGAAQDRYSNAQADERGEYLVGHLMQGRSSVAVMAEGWITRKGIAVEIRTGATADVPDVVLSPARRIDGFVVDEEGTGLPEITVRGTQISTGTRSRARTRADGAFTLWVESDDACTLEVRGARGFENWNGGSGSRFSPGQDVRIVLRRSALFAFRVIDALTREPVTRFGLRLEPKPVLGSYSGAVEREIPLEDHPEGEARVPLTGAWAVVSAPGHAPLETDVVADAGTDDRQTLALRTPALIRGALQLHGDPVARAFVLLQREAIDEARMFQHEPGSIGTRIHYDVGGYSGRKRQIASGADGSFLFGGLAPGTYALTVEAAGLAPKRLRGVEVQPGQALDLGPILLEQGATIRGVLVAGVDETPEGFSLYLRRSLDVFSFGRRLEIGSVDGRFEYTGLEPGTHVLTWSRTSGWNSNDDVEARAQTLVLAEGEVREIAIDATASSPCTVSVRILRDGQPAAGVAVQVRRVKPDGNWSASILATTGADGVARGEVDGDTTFDLVASTGAWVVLGTIASGLVATPGGRIEREFELAIGRLALQLPAGLVAPDPGQVRLVVAAPGRATLVLLAATPGAARGRPFAAPWTGPNIDFGEIEPGEYDATVHVERLEGGGGPPGSEKGIAVRDPCKVRVLVEAGRTATVVVP